MRLLLHNIQYGTGRLKRFSWLATLHPTRRHLKNIERFVRAVRPDIVGLVEVDSGSYRNRRANQAEMLAYELNYHHTHRIKYPETSIGRRIPVLNKQCNAVLARERILKERFHDFHSGFKSLVIEVELPALAVFVVHLSLGLRARHRQLEELHHLLEKCDKPKLLAGDFNALSGRWEMSMFLKATGMHSANLHHTPTFPSWRPYRELDFICHDDRIIPRRFRIPEVRISDHRPLIFDFDIRPADGQF
jgi:endonuclease/exonuclease/phosphatase family metal-dependent hydrolase